MQDQSLGHLYSALSCLKNLKEFELKLDDNEMSGSNLNTLLDSLENHKLSKLHLSICCVNGLSQQEQYGLEFLNRFEALNISDKILF